MVNNEGALTTPRRHTIASRYLDAVTCGGGHTISALTAASPTPVTPERRKTKTNNHNKGLNDSCGMTATTAALDISASWTTTEAPSRSDAASRKSSGAGLKNNRIFPVSDSSGFSGTSQAKGPLGIEDECSSIDSSSSHRRSNRPAHLAVDMDDSFLEKSFEHDDSSSPTSPAIALPSSSRLMKRAREQLEGRRRHRTSAAAAASPSLGSNNHGGNVFSCTGTAGNEPPHEYWSVPSPYQMHRVGELNRSAEKRIRRQVTEEELASSEAGAPTEVMSNQTRRWEDLAGSEAGAATEIMSNQTGRRKDPAGSEAGAPTEIMSNQTRDILKRHFPSALKPSSPPGHSQNETPTAPTSWVLPPKSNENRAAMWSLIDDTSTFDEASQHDSKTQMRALFDVHSSSISASQSTDASFVEERGLNQDSWKYVGEGAQNQDSWKQQARPYSKPSAPDPSRMVYAEQSSLRSGTATKDVAKKVIYGGRVVGAGPRAPGRGNPTNRRDSIKERVDPAKQPQEAHDVPISPVRFYMKDDSTPQPKVVQEVSSSENTASVSTTDGLLLPDVSDGAQRATTFVRYNARRTPNAHEVFQRRYSESSNSSDLSTSEKDYDRGFVEPLCPIQPLFSLDRLDFSYESKSPIRKLHSESQGHEATTSYQGPPTRSESFEAHLKQDLLPKGDVHRIRHTAAQKGEQQQRFKSSQATRFAVKKDSGQSIQPDPIFCPTGSISFSSRSATTAQSFEHDYSPNSIDDHQGGMHQPYIASVQGRSTKGHSSSGMEEELVDIMKRTREGNYYPPQTQSEAVHVAHHVSGKGRAPCSEDRARARSSETDYSNMTPKGRNAVKDRIQAFNRTPPDKWEQKATHQPQTDELAGVVHEEKKEESSFLEVDLNRSIDSTARSVRNLREKFEKNELESRNHDAARDAEDDDSGSVKSLRDKLERRISAMENSVHHDEDDEGSVRSLRDRFESPRNRRSGVMVNHLRSRFESTSAPRGLPKFRASGIPRPSMRPTDSSAAAVQLQNFQRKDPASSAEEKMFETLVNDAPVYKKQIMTPDTEEQSLELDADDFVLVGDDAAMELQPRNAVLPTPAPESQSRSDINDTINRYLHQTNSDLTVKATGGSIAPGEDEDTISTHNSQGRGPAPTSFLSMKGRLLKFSKAEVSPTAKTEQKRLSPPTMQQRLNRWAKRHQPARRAPLASQDERIPESSPTEDTEITRTGSYDLSSVSKDENEHEETDDKPVVSVGFFNRTNKSVRENYNRPNARDADYGIGPKTLPEEAQRMTTEHPPHEGTRPGYSTSSKSEKIERIRRDDSRGKSSDTDYSDGVTLDASIADVSMLSDPTIGRDPEHQYSTSLPAAKKSKATAVQSTERAFSVDELVPNLRTLSDKMSGQSTGDSSLDANLRALETETVATENEMMSVGNDQEGAEADDSGWDITQISNSFSFQTASSKGFGESVSQDGDSFQEVEWPRLDDNDWTDFSSNPTPADNRGDNGFHRITWDGGISSLARKQNTEPQTVDHTQHAIVHHPVMPVQAPAASTSSNMMSSYNRHSGKTPQDMYSTDDESSLQCSEGASLPSTPLPFDKDYETLMEARHKMLLSRQRAHQERKAARDKDIAVGWSDVPAEPPGLRMSDFDPSVIPLAETARQKPRPSSPQRGFFGRTNPPSTAPMPVPTNSRSSKESYRNRAQAPASKPQSTPATATRQTNPTTGKTSTPVQKPTSFLSRITGSMGRTNTSSKHEKFVTRLKSVKAKRLLRKHKMPTHQPLSDEKSVGSFAKAPSSSSYRQVSASRPATSPHTIQSHTTPPNGDRSQTTLNRSARSYRAVFANNTFDDPASDPESSSSDHILENFLDLD